LLKFFGNERQDFLFPEAEVQRFHYELLHSRTNLAATRLHFERGRLMRDIGAESSPRFDKTAAFQVLIDFGDGQRVDAQFRRELASRRELHAVRKLARKDALLDLLLQLQIKRHAAIGVEQKHSVVVNYITIAGGRQ